MFIIKIIDNYLLYMFYNSQYVLFFVFFFISREVKEEMVVIYVKNYMGGYFL